jgi:hypothetical protein
VSRLPVKVDWVASDGKWSASGCWADEGQAVVCLDWARRLVNDALSRGVQALSHARSASAQLSGRAAGGRSMHRLCVCRCCDGALRGALHRRTRCRIFCVWVFVWKRSGDTASADRPPSLLAEAFPSFFLFLSGRLFIARPTQRTSPPRLRERAGR